MTRVLINDHLADHFGRTFPYLRLSITDVCNFRCSYCLPDGYKRTSCESFLSQDEIVRLARAFARRGAWKVRLTGGEPTVRPDFLTIAERIRDIEGIRKLAVTTNGYRLPQRAAAFRRAGINAINISIDTLDAAKFKTITGHDRLSDVTDGLHACLDEGFDAVKVNSVLLRGMNDDEIEEILEFIQNKPITWRFIELMRTNDNVAYFEKHHLTGAWLIQQLTARGWSLIPRGEAAGPALEYEHPDSLGRIGVIAPYSKDFCKSCNRLRVSARGELHLCLFGDGGYSLRELLSCDDQIEALCAKVSDLLDYKHSGHYLHQNDSGMTPHLASIGG